ncbi:MAG: hypothetical protein ABIH18_04455 [Candidatus Omnitrophota bacterium]
MFTLNIDDNKNKLTIICKGHFDIHEAEQFYSQIQEIIPKLKNGCIVFTDLSLLEQMDVGAKKFISKAMDLLNKKQVSEVIRIIPDKSRDIGFNIMSIFHYSSGTKIYSYNSYQEAKEHFKDKI